MKKIILSAFVFAGVILFTGSVYASTPICGNPALNHPEQQVYDPLTLSTTTIPEVNNVSCSSGNPEEVMSVWGRNSDVPRLHADQTTTDEGGLTYSCPSWIGLMGCVDITHTSYYRGQMQNVGRQLKAFGVSGGMFGYWINQAQ